MFLEQIPVNGESAVAAAQLRSALRAAKAEKAAPGSSGMYNAWDEVRGLLENRVSVGDDSSLSAVANGGTVTMTRPPQSRLEEVISALDTHDLDMMAMNDLYWDRIVSIEEDGVEEVFDATVVGAHNFVANGVTVNNSIEQDADMVILLHREDVYDKESPRAGEADVIVAKHRNGPTKTIVVAFQGHYSRFANMALEGF